ncbi:MAG: hypothetical protein KF862_09585 [Chitinophagaceae bacterium]|nr:hypothetical protein [Chitinophagaceae bacterium]
MKTKRETFEIISGDKLYTVNAASYLNGSDQLRFRVSVNNSPVCIFRWDEGSERFAIMRDDRDPVISTSLEKLIAQKLENISEVLQTAA